MVPFVIGGVAALGGVLLGALTDVLGVAKKKVWAVVWISRGQVQGRVFEDEGTAIVNQNELARHGRASILVVKEDGDYRGLRHIRAVTPQGHVIEPAKTGVRRMSGGIPRIGARRFDTKAEQEATVLLTTRFPTSEESQQERFGPYPPTDAGEQESMPESPLFHETTSDHSWKSDVTVEPVPDKYFPGHGQEVQPDMLTVSHTPEIPEEESAIEETSTSHGKVKNRGKGVSEMHQSGRRLKRGGIVLEDAELGYEEVHLESLDGIERED